MNHSDAFRQPDRRGYIVVLKYHKLHLLVIVINVHLYCVAACQSVLFLAWQCFGSCRVLGMRSTSSAILRLDSESLIVCILPAKGTHGKDESQRFLNNDISSGISAMR